MGTTISRIFVDVSSLPHDVGGFIQILFLAAVYGYILCYGSNMIKDGSELLLLVPALAGVVGSIVLPVLGAVPDGAIVLFSGMGDDAQSQVSVGVGALAGSTIMLLTVPWMLSIYGGRVNLDEAGNANYVRGKNVRAADFKKLDPPNRYLGTGINVGPSIAYSARIMLLTLISFLVIQVPAFAEKCGKTDDESKCNSPKYAALVGAILAALLFAFYLWDQARLAHTDDVKQDLIDELRKQAVMSKLLSLRGIFGATISDTEGNIVVEASNKRFQNFLKPFFKRYDQDCSGEIDRSEFTLLVSELGEAPDKDTLNEMMKKFDTNNDGTISFDEFCVAMVSIVNDTSSSTREDRELKKELSVATKTREEAEENEEEEDGEMPEDLASLSPQEQQRKLLIRSFSTMGIGVGLVLLFSDPMVDVLTELGARTRIKPFFVAFILAPLASNASELIAAFAYSQKKTEKSITISFASLVGAACMNNTFCLSLFLFLIYFRDLKWVFSAETIAILVVELIMFGFASKRVHKTWYALVVISLFPLSICLVIILEALGLD